MTEAIEQLPDGIYFRLPQEAYHGQRRLSASGCCNLLVSPATFWADSWLNPEREEVGQDTPARIYGSAAHVGTLEPERFSSAYVSLPNPDDYGTEEQPLLTTHAAIKAVLKERGEPQTKGDEGVLGAAIRLRESGYGGPIWHLIMDEFEAARPADQIALPPKVYTEITRDIERMKSNTEIMKQLEGGEAEVSILWTDKGGVQWKARLDKMQERGAVDLKTFDNARGTALDECIRNAIQYNRYHVQARVYIEAMEAVRAGLRICKIQNQGQKDLVEAIRASTAPFQYWWIFREKGGVPNLLARRLRMTGTVHPSHLVDAPDAESRARLEASKTFPSRLWEKAGNAVKLARQLYVNGLEIWGTDQPWQALVPVSDIDDEAFSSFWLEQEI